MEIWAKLFESNGRQVLITKEEDDDGNLKIGFSIKVEDGKVEIGKVFKGGNAEERRDKFFDALGQEAADRYTENFTGCKSIQAVLEALS